MIDITPLYQKQLLSQFRENFHDPINPKTAGTVLKLKSITNFCVLLVISSLKMKLKFSYYQKYQNIRLLNRDGAPPTVSKSKWGGGGGGAGK